MTPGNGQEAGAGRRDAERARASARPWLAGEAAEPEPEAAAAVVRRRFRHRRPFWVPRQPEPELLPIPFAGDDSASRRTQPEPDPDPSPRADEGPHAGDPPLGGLRGARAEEAVRRGPRHRRNVAAGRRAHGGDPDRSAAGAFAEPPPAPLTGALAAGGSGSGPARDRGAGLDDVDRAAQGNALVGLSPRRRSDGRRDRPARHAGRRAACRRRSFARSPGRSSRTSRNSSSSSASRSWSRASSRVPGEF